jgi:hypothetical protein
MKRIRALIVAAGLTLGVTAATVVTTSTPVLAHNGCSSGPAYGNGTYSYCPTWSTTRSHRAVAWCRNAYGYVIVRYGQWTWRGYHSYAFCPSPYQVTNWGHQHG